ncbi:MAG: conjugal transfer protein TraG N-terminal domain-containing protein [Gammaproteobacteria bacterium]|nr:conjugal transfer protein TraG N-terminal domain-containing protein [Gammaproteobacteria bacterium]
MQNFLGVSSLTELHTAILGWHQYNVLWDILTQTGLVFLPFLFIIIQGFTDSIKSQRPSDAGFTSLKRVELELIGMLTLMVLAGQPLMPLVQQELTFVQNCVTANENNDEALYKKVVHSREVTHTRVPIWWVAVISISEGVTSAAKRSIPCVSDAMWVYSMVNELRITDPVLQTDLEQFIDECYHPTLKFDRYERQELPPDKWESKEYQQIKSELLLRYDENKMVNLLSVRQVSSPQALRRIQSALEKASSGFTEWMGSELYLQMPGPYFYQGRVMNREYQNRVGVYKPTCAQVWNGFVVDWAREGVIPGLYPRLKKLINADPRPIEEVLQEAVVGNYSDWVTEWLSRHGGLLKAQKTDNETVYQWILMQWLPTLPIMSDLTASYPSLNRYSSPTVWGATKKLLVNLGSIMGAVVESLEFFPMMYTLQQAAPVVQGLVLMSVYLMLPIGLILSGFSIEFLLMGAAGIFTLKFMSYFFHLANWLNLYLLKVLGVTQGSVLGEWVMPLVVMTMFFALPLLFMSMLLWAGYEVGGAYAGYQAVGGEGSALQESGRRGVQLVGQVVDAGLAVATAGISKGAGIILQATKIGLEVARLGVRALRK